MTLQNRINELVRQLAHPFLVLTYLALPAKQGGYSEWGPWVAAISIHSFALTKRVGLQDRRPLEAASAILKALRENEPDNSFFYRKRREIECLAPDLIKVLLSAYEKAERMVVQDDKIEPFIDEDCFPSLMQTGGWSLLVGK